MNREEKIRAINGFMSQCMDANEEFPNGLTYRDISKVVSERYATQNVEVVKIFFRTKGSKSNNKPYTFPEELPVGTATRISDDLLEIRTTTNMVYGDTIRDDHETSAWEDNYTEDEVKELKELM